MFKREYKIDPRKHDFVIGLDVSRVGFWEDLEDAYLLGAMTKELCEKFAEKTNRSEVRATFYYSNGGCRERIIKGKDPSELSDAACPK